MSENIQIASLTSEPYSYISSNGQTITIKSFQLTKIPIQDWKQCGIMKLVNEERLYCFCENAERLQKLRSKIKKMSNKALLEELETWKKRQNETPIRNELFTLTYTELNLLEEERNKRVTEKVLQTPSETQGKENISIETVSHYLKENGDLDVDTLLKDFQKFYRENAEFARPISDHLEKDLQVLLYSFAQRINGIGGEMQLEAIQGDKRIDIKVKFKNATFILELKRKYSTKTEEEGKTQLCEYLDRLNLENGYLLLFEQKPSSEITWNERIRWETVSHSYSGKNYNIIIVGMKK